MSSAIKFAQAGGPEVLEFIEMEVLTWLRDQPLPMPPRRAAGAASPKPSTQLSSPGADALADADGHIRRHAPVRACIISNRLRTKSATGKRLITGMSGARC